MRNDMNRNPHMIRTIEVSKAFGSKRVLTEIDLRIPAGQIVSLVGPSGCGKSTLLNCIAGTHLPTSGDTKIYDEGVPTGYRVITSPGRDRGIVYQHYSLFPNLTAIENVAFGLVQDEMPFPKSFFWKWASCTKDLLETAGGILGQMGLADALNLYPGELSGGMCQRVAIAQALVMKPKILLLDEPFSGLDRATKDDLQGLLRQLYAENLEARDAGKVPPNTVLLVTHELDDALSVSDRIVGVSQYYEGNTPENHLGAKVVYDQLQQVFDPKSQRDHEESEKVHSDVFTAAYDKRVFQDPAEFVNSAQREERMKGGR